MVSDLVTGMRSDRPSLKLGSISCGSYIFHICIEACFKVKDHNNEHHVLNLYLLHPIKGTHMSDFLHDWSSEDNFRKVDR